MAEMGSPGAAARDGWHLELRLATRDAGLATLNGRLAEALGRVEAERERVAPLERALAERLPEEERRQRGLFAGQLRAMQRSTFWRATWPARSLANRLRAIRAGRRG